MSNGNTNTPLQVTKVKLSFAKISARKVRIAGDLIRGKKVGQAANILKFTPKRGAKILEKMLTAAVANIDKKDYPNPEELKVGTLMVDCGPIMKRFQPRAMGRAAKIRKRTSHVTLVLTK